MDGSTKYVKSSYEFLSMLANPGIAKRDSLKGYHK